MELTTSELRFIEAEHYADGSSYLRISEYDSYGKTVGVALNHEEARKIADALDPTRTDGVLTREECTLDEARALGVLVARLESAARERAEGVEALRKTMLSPETSDFDQSYAIAAERAYDRGVRAPKTEES